MPTPAALHVNQPLSNLSVQYRNDDHIWREVMPIVPVGKRSDVYYVYNKKDAYKVADDKIGPKGQANEIDWDVTTDNYSVKDHALGDWYTQEEVDNADSPISVPMDTNDNLNAALDLTQEKRVADKVFAAANYPTGNKVTLSGTAQWSGSADDPIANVQTAIEACFMRANVLVFGIDAWLVFRRLPEILDAVKSSTRSQGSPGGFAGAAEVATLFEVDRILIGRARLNGANPGQAASYSRVWGKHMAALRITPGVGIKTISFGKTFVQQDRLTMEDFDSKRGVKGAHYMKVGWNSDEKIVASDLGYLITDAVA